MSRMKSRHSSSQQFQQQSSSPLLKHNSKAPMESVVIPHDNESQYFNVNVNNKINESNVNDNLITSGKQQASPLTNIQVCVRIRPLLPSDHINKINSNIKISSPRGVTKSGSARFFKKSPTAAAIGVGPVMKTHNSGLATPVRSQLGNLDNIVTPLVPVWITNPADPQIIYQCPSHSAHSNEQQHHNQYTFDRVYGPTESTRRLYKESVASIVESVVRGFHGSVFAYGQTNSGKTHTMTGIGNSSKNDSNNTGNENDDDEGVIRMAVKDIFQRIVQNNFSHDSLHDDSDNPLPQCQQHPREYLLRVSYLEIYNEQIYDLLAPTNDYVSHGRLSTAANNSTLQHHHLPPSTAVRIFESRTEGVVIRGLREEIVTCPEDVFNLLDMGDARRKVGSTGMNKTSSRSHSVFRLVLESRISSSCGSNVTKGTSNSKSVPSIVPSSNSSMTSDAGDSVTSAKSSVTQSFGPMIKGPVRISSLSLVDLAGSESVKATGSTGIRQKEGQYINKSLLTLGHVVHKLSELSSNANKDVSTPGLLVSKEHIPYRDSKLTRLLQPSLGGNAQVCIICNISPSLSNLEEGHNTLKFASRAKRIQQHARITEVVDEKTLLRSYREEIEELKRQLKEARNSAAELTAQTMATKSSFTEENSLSEDEYQDDTHVLIAAINNLESLILKTDSKSSKKMMKEASSIDVSMIETEMSPQSRRSLDEALIKLERNSNEGTESNLSTPSINTSAMKYFSKDEDDRDHLLEELHRIQSMLGRVMKNRKEKPIVSTIEKLKDGSSKKSMRDEEIERLRIQLQEHEAVTTIRKADSTFLESQLYEKENLLKEVSVLLEALEKRQLALERENTRLREDLALVTALMEEAEEIKKVELV